MNPTGSRSRKPSGAIGVKYSFSRHKNSAANAVLDDFAHGRFTRASYLGGGSGTPQGDCHGRRSRSAHASSTFCAFVVFFRWNPDKEVYEYSAVMFIAAWSRCFRRVLSRYPVLEAEKSVNNGVGKRFLHMPMKLNFTVVCGARHATAIV